MPIWTIELLPVGDVAPVLLETLRQDLTWVLQSPCEVLTERLEPEFALHRERGQYYSSQILARMRDWNAGRAVGRGTRRLLGVTAADLYIPILTFVFGEAELHGVCAVVSLHRLRQEFYGMPPDARTERERVLKEALHELGHTFGLAHCEDYQCVMAPSHSVEWIDLKDWRFCADCCPQVGGEKRPCQERKSLR